MLRKLVDCKVGQGVIIKAIPLAKNIKSKLVDLGIIPEQGITLERKLGNKGLMVKLAEVTILLRYNIANHILVIHENRVNW